MAETIFTNGQSFLGNTWTDITDGTNLDFETGDFTGWTTDIGTPRILGGGGGGQPTGTYAFKGGASDSVTQVSQEITIPANSKMIQLTAVVGGDAADYDQGISRIKFTQTGTLLGEGILLTSTGQTDDTWFEKTAQCLVPAGADKCEIVCRADRGPSGTSNNGCVSEVKNVRWLIGTTALDQSTNRLTNGDFEAGNLSSWSLFAGNSCQVVTESAFVAAGTYGMRGNSNTGGSYQQDATGTIPAGAKAALLKGWVAKNSNADNDEVRLKLYCRNAGGTTLSTQTLWGPMNNIAKWPMSIFLEIPVGAVRFDCQFQTVRRNGTALNAGADEIEFYFFSEAVAGPDITGPDNTTVAEFDNAVFTVSATGVSPFTYQWYQVGVGALGGETGTTLTITSVQYPGDDGNQYYCDVTDNNLVTVSSATATLTVTDIASPVFTLQPDDLFPLDGEQLTIQVLATGEAPITYQWYESGVGALVGETAASLTQTYVAADAGKEFFCEAADVHGQTTDSNTSLVTIVTVPTIIVEPTPQTVIEFRNATFSAQATGNGPFQYDWYNDIDGLVGLNAGESFVYDTAFADDGKQFYCIVTDIYNHTSQTVNALLTVQQCQHADDEPFIDADIVGPADVNVPVGQTANFAITMNQAVPSFPPYTFDWYSVEDGLVSPNNGPTYSFTPLETDQGKHYFAVVTDTLGQLGQSRESLLTIEPATLNLSWSVADAQVDETVLVYQSIAWSLEDAAQAAGGFTCPVRTHRGLDDDGRTYWIPFYDKSARASRGPLVNDAFNRYYWTQDGQDMRYAPLDNLKLDSRTIGIDVGVPPPARAPNVSPPLTGDGVLETRAYVYTYVSVYGEEGPPSSPHVATGYSDEAWNLSEMSTGPTDDKLRRLTVKRIYRTITGTAGDTDYYLVATLPIQVSTFRDNRTTNAVALNNTLESTNWFPPPEGLSGLIAHPNGFFIGFVGRDIYTSEPYRPHAWNPAYVVSTLGDVVGFGIFGTTVVVCTESFPYTLTGIHPGAMVFSQHDTPEPCVARYGIVSMPFGVYFPGPNGLMLASPSGFQNATKELMTKEEWQNRYNVRQFDAAQYQSQYVAFYSSTKGIMFAPDEPMAALVDLDLTGADAEPDQMETIFTDIYSGKTFLIENCNMYEWNPVSGAPLEFDWTSMEFDSADPLNFGAGRIIWYSRWTPPTEEQTQEWRNYNETRIAAAPLNPFNFHSINEARFVPAPGSETVPQIKQPFHWSPLIWVPQPGEKWPNTPFVIMELIANEEVVYSEEIVDTDIFRLPSGWKATRFKVRLRSNIPIQSCKLAETGKELSSV